MKNHSYKSMEDVPCNVYVDHGKVAKYAAGSAIIATLFAALTGKHDFASRFHDGKIPDGYWTDEEKETLAKLLEPDNTIAIMDWLKATQPEQ